METAEEGIDSHFHLICEGAYLEYKGENHCAYNVARSLADSVALLKSKVSSKPEDWIWRNLHRRQYSYLPWSKTPLRFLFHREVPFGGNNNTPNVSGCKLRSNKDNTVFESIHVAAYKMVVMFSSDEEKEVNLYSIDTGMNGNLFQGHYFDMNSDHINGRLREMKIGRKIEGTPISRLFLRKAPEKPVMSKKPE